ncbi:MAG: glycosyltransferase family 4 protein, partial [Actinomycetota bacterium]|nr:glycosyltransferase family 4 protein [Actinomycetota bacterium]
MALAEPVGPLSGQPAGSGTRILIVVADSLGERMAGPAIRAWQMARVLGHEHEVVLATTSRCDRVGVGFTACWVDEAKLRSLVGWCAVVVVRGFVTAAHPWLLTEDRILVADVYDPMHLEALEQHRNSGADVRRRAWQGAVLALNDQLLRADLVLCASERQRDFWLGAMAALGRVDPAAYDDDATLRRLLAVVPFGLPEVAPARTRAALRGVVPGIEPGDEVIIWGGGIYDWFDPLTLVRAVDRLRRRRPSVRLFFLGMAHPDAAADGSTMAGTTRALAAELGLLGQHVFFNTGWVVYDDRANYLLDADIGVSTHRDSLETAFAFRTRVLDYLWAGLPVVTTAGDTLADLVTARDLGVAVPPGDVRALEEALFTLLDDEHLAVGCRQRVAGVAAELTWPVVLAPVLAFCRQPRRAADRLATSQP